MDDGDCVIAKCTILRRLRFGAHARGRLYATSTAITWHPFIPIFFSTQEMATSEIQWIREDRSIVGSGFMFSLDGGLPNFRYGVFRYKRLRAMLKRVGFANHARPSWPGVTFFAPRGIVVEWTSQGPAIEGSSLG